MSNGPVQWLEQLLKEQESLRLTPAISKCFQSFGDKKKTYDLTSPNFQTSE